MSTLRKTYPAQPSSFCPTNGTAYFMIYNAIRGQKGLIHGKLDNSIGEHCAIGSYFALRQGLSLTDDIIDEVAAVNDSLPHATKRQRKFHVLRWLRWKLAEYGVSGFKKKK